MLLACATTSVSEKEERLNSANAHIELAFSYLAENEFTAALEQLQKSDSIAAYNAELDHAYAIYHQKTGATAKAVSYFQSALEKEPGNPRFNNNYGALLSQAGDYTSAYKHFQIAYSDKDYIQRSAAYENYGDAASLNTDYERAIPAYETALELSPEWFILHIKLAKSHYNKANFELAYSYLSTYMRSIQDLNVSPSIEDLELGIGIAAALKDFEGVQNYQDLLINLE